MPPVAITRISAPAEFELHLPDDLLYRTDISVQNARLNVGNRCFADDLRREYQLDGRQFRRAGGKRAVHHAQTWADSAAEELRFSRNHAIGRRRAEIDKNRRAPVQR